MAMMHSRDRHHAAALTASLLLPRWYETAAELGLISEGDLRTEFVANQPVSPGWMVSVSRQALRTLAGGL